jgi:hypothetical protein
MRCIASASKAADKPRPRACGAIAMEYKRVTQVFARSSTTAAPTMRDDASRATVMVADALARNERQLRAEMRSPEKDAFSSSKSACQSSEEASSMRIEPEFGRSVIRPGRFTAMGEMSASALQHARGSR